MKKIISVVVAVILATTFCGSLTGCNNSDELENRISKIEQEIQDLKNSLEDKNSAIELAKEKQTAIEEISNYANQAIEDNFYSNSNYQIIIATLNDFIDMINKATAEDVITEKVTEFKNEIDEIAITEANFVCYTLQEAYDNAFIDLDNLKSIAYFNNEKYSDGYVSAGIINKKYATAIKKAFIEINYEENIIIEDVNDVYIFYLGTYNDSIAVSIVVKSWCYYDASWDETVESITFTYSNLGIRATLWKIRI